MLSLSPNIFYCTLTLQIDISFDDGIILFLYQINKRMGFPDGSVVKNPPAMRETWVRSLGWEDPLEEGMATHSSFLAWRIPMDRGAWQATVQRVTKSQTRLKRLGTHARSPSNQPSS